MTIDPFSQLYQEGHLAGVIGWPIHHSLSPTIHRYWLEQEGVAGWYQRIALPPKNLAQGLAALRLTGFSGVNVTIPHKEKIIPLLDEVTPLAQRIGAVNMVSFDENGHMQGDNSDYWGFWQPLAQRDWQTTARDHPIILLGAGGAARAVLAALGNYHFSHYKNSAPLYLVNRNLQRAQALAAEFSCEYMHIEAVSWEARQTVLKDAGLLINTTSCGMIGQPDLVLDLRGMYPKALIYDLVYNPIMTTLLRAAQQQNLAYISGLEMLIAQARPGFTRWFDISSPKCKNFSASDPQLTALLEQVMRKRQNG